jgi:hypothetical protein
MQSIFSEVKKLCTPAFVYLVIATLGLIKVMLQNVGNSNTLCVGRVQCSVPNTAGMFLIQAAWILFWTWVLSTLCKNGHPNVAWFLVLLPFIIFLIALVAFADMVAGNHQSMTTVANQASNDIMQQQQRDGVNMNLRIQQGYLESGAHSGVKVYQI